MFIHCPKCNESIDSENSACPSCGANFTNTDLAMIDREKSLYEAKVKKKSKSSLKVSKITVLLFAILDSLVIAIIGFDIGSPYLSVDSCWLFKYNGVIWFDHDISRGEITYPAGTIFKINTINTGGEVTFTDPDTGNYFYHGFYITDAANSSELQESLKQLKLQGVRKEFRTRAITGGVCFLVCLVIFWFIDMHFGVFGNIITFLVTIIIFWGFGYLLNQYLSRAHAPVIYLYPQSETEVSVSLALTGRFTETYPSFNQKNGWIVKALPDGTLTYKNGEKHPFLYWEADLAIKPDLSHGYCVRGEDTKEFLEISLKQLGLSDIEYGDFIGYWLPKLEGNKYNVITFQTTAYENVASMKVSPEPDTVIRVNMLWYPSDSFVEIEPQELTSINPSVRKGFTVVEWGGEEYRGRL